MDARMNWNGNTRAFLWLISPVGFPLAAATSQPMLTEVSRLSTETRSTGIS